MHQVEVCWGGHNKEQTIGIRVRSSDATVADLLEVWQSLAEDTRVRKKYAGPGLVCRGCQSNCCSNPFVIPDLIAIKQMADHLSMSYSVLIDTYCCPHHRQKGLLKLKSEPCIFLQDNLCTIYPYRSLTCRFYLCSSLLGETEQIIYSIAWTGIAAAWIFARQEGIISGPAHGTHRPGRGSFEQICLDLIAKYSRSPNVDLFLNACQYSHIPLKPFLSSEQ